MRLSLIASLVALAAAAAPAASWGQQRDTAAARRDSIAKAKADSAAAADSIRLLRELERIQAEPRAPQPPAAMPAGGAASPINPRLLPDISVVGDLIGDLSPDESTQEDRSRFGVRELELALQAAVDPYFRGDVFIGVSDAEGVAIEQAYLTAMALPYALEARLGRFLMPVGKQNTTHRHDLHTVEYPYIIQRFFGAEGLRGTGVWASKIFAPFGFFQEFLATVVDRFGEEVEGAVVERPVNRKLKGLGYSARFRNYIDLNEAANVELSASAVTGLREQFLVEPFGDINALAVRQTVLGADVTYRWRPLQQGLYRSLILQAEVMRQFNDRRPPLPPGALYAGPDKDVTGLYLFARYQLTRRLYVGSRYDWIERAIEETDHFSAASAYLQWYPSEFSKLLAGYERVWPGDGTENTHRLLLQASFALGPHRPHPF